MQQTSHGRFVGAGMGRDTHVRPASATGPTPGSALRDAASVYAAIPRGGGINPDRLSERSMASSAAHQFGASMAAAAAASEDDEADLAGAPISARNRSPRRAQTDRLKRGGWVNEEAFLPALAAAAATERAHSPSARSSPLPPSNVFA